MKHRFTENIYIEFTEKSIALKNFLPVNNFCVRKASAIYFKNRYWIYADVVHWENPFWPDTYGTDIHLFSSKDARLWKWHGKLVEKGKKGEWNYGGVGTPGAVVCKEKVFIFFKGDEKPNGERRYIGMAVSKNPAGPFKKIPDPLFTSEGHLDDPSPIEINGKIYLYFREAIHKFSPPKYEILLTVSSDEGKKWSKPERILSAEKDVYAYETAEAKKIKDVFILSCFEHRKVNGRHIVKTNSMFSEDGVNFKYSPDPYLDETLFKWWIKPVCAFQWCLLPEKDGSFKNMGIVQTVDEKGHYNLTILPVKVGG